MSKGKGKLSKFIEWITNLIDSVDEEDLNIKRVLTQDDFKGAGVHYYESNIDKLATPNPDWKKRTATIINEGKAGKRIFKNNYVNRPVKLVEEPDNPNDRNAVAIVIAGELVGYISRDDNVKVKGILKKREIKSISGFIGGGEYKIVSEDGTVWKDKKGHNVTVRIKYI